MKEAQKKKLGLADQILTPLSLKIVDVCKDSGLPSEGARMFGGEKSSGWLVSPEGPMLRSKLPPAQRSQRSSVKTERRRSAVQQQVTQTKIKPKSGNKGG